MNNLYKIIDKTGKIVTFKFNNHQEKIWQDTTDKKGNLISDVSVLKSRQIGMTTYFVLFYLDDVIFIKNITSGILSHDRDSLGKIFDKARFAYENLHPLLKPLLDRGGGSKYEMKFPEINSKIFTDLDVRSETLHRLHISEAAFADEKRILATIGALPAHIKHSVETTPNGMNQFYNEWVDTKSMYKKFFFPWFSHSDYVMPNLDTGNFDSEEISLSLTREQVEFRRAKKQQLKSLFRQEYPENDIDCFLSSGLGFFDTQDLNDYTKSSSIICETYLAESGGKEHVVKLFEKPIPGEKYIIAADVSEGLSVGDFSFVTCFRVSTRAEVAFAQLKVQPYDLAHILADLGNYFNKAMIAVERNNHGHAVLQELDRHIFYPKIYAYTEGRIGWLTDKITRPLMLDTLHTGITNRTVKINNPIFFSEAQTFVEDSGKFSALPGYFDDSIMAVAIAIQVLGANIVNPLPKQNVTKRPISHGLKSNNW